MGAPRSLAFCANVARNVFKLKTTPLRSASSDLSHPKIGSDHGPISPLTRRYGTSHSESAPSKYVRRASRKSSSGGGPEQGGGPLTWGGPRPPPFRGLS